MRKQRWLRAVTSPKREMGDGTIDAALLAQKHALVGMRCVYNKQYELKNCITRSTKNSPQSGGFKLHQHGVHH